MTPRRRDDAGRSRSPTGPIPSGPSGSRRRRRSSASSRAESGTVGRPRCALGACASRSSSCSGGESLPDFRVGDAGARCPPRRRPGRRDPGREARRAPHPSRRRGRGRPGVPPARRAILRRCLTWTIIGWIVVGFIAGAISGALLGGSTARGCLPNVIVGILGGVARWLARDADGLRPRPTASSRPLVVAVLGSLVVRLVLNAMSRSDG